MNFDNAAEVMGRCGIIVDVAPPFREYALGDPNVANSYRSLSPENIDHLVRVNIGNAFIGFPYIGEPRQLLTQAMGVVGATPSQAMSYCQHNLALTLGSPSDGIHGAAALGSSSVVVFRHVVLDGVDQYYIQPFVVPYSDIADVSVSKLIRYDPLAFLLALFPENVGDFFGVNLTKPFGRWSQYMPRAQFERYANEELPQLMAAGCVVPRHFAPDGSRYLWVSGAGVSVRLKSNGAVLCLESPYGGFDEFARELVERVTNSMTHVDADSTRECPYCAETIKAKAMICRFCQRDLPPMV